MPDLDTTPSEGIDLIEPAPEGRPVPRHPLDDHRVRLLSLRGPRRSGHRGSSPEREIVAQFLTLGGDEAYLYGYEPGELIQELPCTWGQNMLFQTDGDGIIRHRMATGLGAAAIGALAPGTGR